MSIQILPRGKRSDFRRWVATVVALCVPSLAAAQSADWQAAEANAACSQRAVKFCKRYAQGWLSHADPRTGLLPRTTTGQSFWNAQDCAADNYPFLVLTAYASDDYYLKRAVHHILDQEQKLTCRLDSLPDDFDFATQGWRRSEPDIDALIFAASEYAKDGLMPITEWLGPGPWLDRMRVLVQDIWRHAPIQAAVGQLPSRSVEVNGELLQTMSRLYWLTGDEAYQDWVLRLADHYLLHEDLLASDSLKLRDHGCEILGGLSEAYVIVAQQDPARQARFRPALHAILSRILEVGVNQDGMIHNAVNPKTGAVTQEGLSDGWGHVYNAFLTVAELDQIDRFRDPVANALANLHKYRNVAWEGNGGADGFADSIAGAINLLNRMPVPSAFQWVDQEIEHIFNKQRHDGIIDGWYGDGNAARTALMYALLKTQGITLAPWREDLQLGAARHPDGTVAVCVKSEWPWRGKLRCDRPRHRDFLHLPFDYPRSNQFPEWFTVEGDRSYVVQLEGRAPRLVTGEKLWAFELPVSEKSPVRLTLRALRPGESFPWRSRRYTSRSAADAVAWQQGLRAQLFEILQLADLVSATIPFEPKELSSSEHGTYRLREMEFNSTPGRRMKALVTLPLEANEPRPAVLCIHGHGGDRRSVYDAATIYQGFAAELAARGFVTMAADVGQHAVYESDRTLMGERLWDLMRSVDYLATLTQVDRARVGCAGLSLGGEMAMWLGAMDERIAATVSSGFLTTMDQMEQDHCMCWRFPGLRELVDYMDIYCLVAPRALQCQNGRQEPPWGFYVPLARQAMAEIETIYRDFGQPGQVELAVHPGGHEIDLPALLAFFDRHLSNKP